MSAELDGNWADTVAVEEGDGWTLCTPDRSLGAQFEHTMIVTRDGPLVVT